MIISDNKIAVLVCGMHRSGTSAMTGVLNLFGLYLGDNMLEAKPENSKGFFENKYIYDSNEYILNQLLGSECNTTEEINIDLSRNDILSKIEDTIVKTFGENKIFGIKDPRLCLLLPFYQKIFNKLDYKIQYIRMNRIESEVIDSLSSRNGFTKEKSKKILKRHIESLDKFLPPDYLSINFDDLLYSTDDVICKLKKHLPFLDYSDLNKIKVRNFLDKSLKHF